MTAPRSAAAVFWQQARAESSDPAEQNRIWSRLMIANGHHRTEVKDLVIIHRVLAGHAAGQVCDACPCTHCGTTKDDPDGDHSCPCPYSDNDCPWHWSPPTSRECPESTPAESHVGGVAARGRVRPMAHWRGYDPLACDANDEDGRHEPAEATGNYAPTESGAVPVNNTDGDRR